MVWEGRQDQVLEMQASALLCRKVHEGHVERAQKDMQGAVRGQRLAREVALAELGAKQPFWTGLDEIPQQIIAGYMDVVSLCRTDSTMTGVEERKA